MPACLDHIVVTAPDLDAGVPRVEKALGVSLTFGGRHPGMGTHNCLLKLGRSTYLEVIAPDPQAPHPPQPRWFALDRLPADAGPRLAAWVIRTDDIHTADAGLAPVLGNAMSMTRGDLAWRITVRADGGLPLDGAAPVMIEWQTKPHPASALPDTGCTLADLQVFHPDPEQLLGIFAATELDSRPRVHWSGPEPAHLVAGIDTPAGRRTLGGPADALASA